MNQSNIIFLDLLANILESLPRTNVGLDKQDELRYVKGGKPFVQMDAEWCNKLAQELRKVILEEEMGDGEEE